MSNPVDRRQALAGLVGAAIAGTAASSPMPPDLASCYQSLSALKGFAGELAERHGGAGCTCDFCVEYNDGLACAGLALEYLQMKFSPSLSPRPAGEPSLPVERRILETANEAAAAIDEGGHAGLKAIADRIHGLLSNVVRGEGEPLEICKKCGKVGMNHDGRAFICPRCGSEQGRRDSPPLEGSAEWHAARVRGHIDNAMCLMDAFLGEHDDAALAAVEGDIDGKGEAALQWYNDQAADVIREELWPMCHLLEDYLERCYRAPESTLPNITDDAGLPLLCQAANAAQAARLACFAWNADDLEDLAPDGVREVLRKLLLFEGGCVISEWLYTCNRCGKKQLDMARRRDLPDCGLEWYYCKHCHPDGPARV